MANDLSNDQINFRIISKSIFNKKSEDFQQLLIQMSPDYYYLEKTGVVPILIDVLTHLDKIRPKDPIEFVAAYILFNKGNYDSKPMFKHDEDNCSDLID